MSWRQDPTAQFSLKSALLIQARDLGCCLREGAVGLLFLHFVCVVVL